MIALLNETLEGKEIPPARWGNKIIFIDDGTLMVKFLVPIRPEGDEHA